MYKKLLLLCILITSLFLITGTIYADKMEDFVLSTYSEYGAGKFKQVYNRLHPTIKKNLDQNLYINFQKENFQKYNLIIEKVNVKEIKKIKKLPGKLSLIFPEDYDFKCWQISINYVAHFDTRLGRQKKKLKKNVYLSTQNIKQEKKLYLLWDPSNIKKDKVD